MEVFMRRRQTRPNVFRELKRFGVCSSDWKYILIPTAVVYLIPFMLNVWVGFIPLGFPLGLITFLILVTAFSFLRRSKPKYWLSHKTEAFSEKWARVRPPLGGELEVKDWVDK